MTMIWAVLIGWFVFGQWPEVELLVGGSIVALAGLFVLWREHRLGLMRLRPAERAGGAA
jgi:drug/metabolite transporter (DMT)-like permease